MKSLPEEAIEEFKKLYRKRFNVELTNEEAKNKANNFIALYQAVYGLRHQK